MLSLLRAAGVAAALVGLAGPAATRAHGVSHEVERRGAAFAVRVRYDGGAPLAGATYQVVRPGKSAAVHAQGTTDAQGWAEFVPDAPGRWKVRVVDASGHGAVVPVDVAHAPEPPSGPAAR